MKLITLVLGLVASFGLVPAQAKTNEKHKASSKSEKKEEKKSPETAVTNLVTEDLKVGAGAEAVAGKEVRVYYTGWLTDGKKFDSSTSGKGFSFSLGSGQVIKGWDEGVKGMKVGGKRKLTIPADMGYGARGAGGVIPPNATLVFEVELLEVK